MPTSHPNKPFRKLSRNSITPLLIALALLTSTAAHAQVSFSGVQTTLPTSGLNEPYGVAVDKAGDVFIADSYNNRVLEIPAGGGPQTTVPASGLKDPDGVAVDQAGDVFIADFENNRVVEIPAAGGSQTTAGSGLNHPFGVTIDAAGNLFIADTFNNRVVEVPAGGGAQITVAGALNSPHGVAVDETGDLFIADTENNRVVEIPAGGGPQTTVGSGLNQPYGVAVDAAGDLFIADTQNSRLLEIPAGGGPQTMVGSGVSHPFAVTVDGTGDVFVADTANHRAVEIQTVAVKVGSVNTGSSTNLTLNYSVESDEAFGTPNVLTQGSPNLDFTLASGSTCSGLSLKGGSSCTVNVTFTPKFAGARNGAVELVDASGNVLATTLIYGIGAGPQIAFNPGVQTTLPASGLFNPFAVALDGAGDLYIADYSNRRVLKLPAGGGAPTTIGSGLSVPDALAVDGAGDVFITDPSNHRVLEVTPGGVQTDVGAGLIYPNGVAVDGAGNVFIADISNNNVVKVSAGGVQTTVVTGLNSPHQMTLDAAGDLFIADTGNNRVLEVTPAGVQTTVGYGLDNPFAAAVDAAGDVFIADARNNRIVEVPAGCASSSCQITHGSGLTSPYGVALNAAGDLFIADTSNDRALEINRSQPPTLSFAATSVGSTSSDSPQSVAIESIGNATLSATAPGLLIGANFEQVAGSGTPADCTASFSLVPGASCNLSLSFTPTVSGPIQNSALLTDNALNANPATQTVPLKGTGIALTQTITFNPILSQLQGTTVPLSASASSGLPVGSTSLTPGICTVSGTAATLINPGTCTLQASQPGNAQYAAAMPVTQSFTVTPAANFTITPIPPAETVYRDRLGGVILKLQSVNGFSGKVTLTCSGGPAGTKCADLPGTVNVNGTAYAISGVLFPAKTPAGTYLITFTGVSGSLTDTTNVKFTVK